MGGDALDDELAASAAVALVDLLAAGPAGASIALRSPVHDGSSVMLGGAHPITTAMLMPASAASTPAARWPPAARDIRTFQRRSSSGQTRVARSRRPSL